MVLEFTTLITIFIVISILVILMRFVGFAFRIAGVLLLIFIAYSVFSHGFAEWDFDHSDLITSPNYDEESQEFDFTIGSYEMSGKVGENKIYVEKNGEEIRTFDLPEPVEARDGAVRFSEGIWEKINEEIEENSN